MPECIFLAEPTRRVLKVYPAYRDFFPALYAALAAFHPVEVLDLPDIWVRDFLPLQHSKTGELSRLLFKPRYANYTPKFTEDIRRRVHELFPVRFCGVGIDGGNIIPGPDNSFFCFEGRRIFRRTSPGEQEMVERKLAEALGSKKIVWLPREIGDKVNHIDGFMQFVGDTLLVSDERFDPYLEKLTYQRLERVRHALGKVAVQFLPYVPDRSDKSGLSACGVYVNFLETSRAVFVPQYHLPQDKQALSIIGCATSKPVVGIDCAQIARYGGAVHCLTQSYCKEP